jgi:hypothetical protein
MIASHLFMIIFPRHCGDNSVVKFMSLKHCSATREDKVLSSFFTSWNYISHLCVLFLHIAYKKTHTHSHSFILLYYFYLVVGPHLLRVNCMLIWERTVFKIAGKLSKLLLGIITLVSSANKMGSDKIFIVGGRSSILWNAKALKLTLGELHVLLLPILRKIFVMILFQFFVFYQTGSEPVSYFSLNAIII